MILVVDDNQDDLKYISRMMQNAGIPHETYLTAHNALVVFARNPIFYQAAFLDVFLPGQKMDGLTLGKELKKIKPSIEIVFITGLRDRLNIKLLEEVGRVFHKEFSPQAFAEFLNEFWLNK